MALDQTCCITTRTQDGTRVSCNEAAIWAIERYGSPLTFTCRQDLEVGLLLAYANEPEQTTVMSVVPIKNLTVNTNVTLRPIAAGLIRLGRPNVERQ